MEHFWTLLVVVTLIVTIPRSISPDPSTTTGEPSTTTSDPSTTTTTTTTTTSTTTPSTGSSTIPSTSSSTTTPSPSTSEPPSTTEASTYPSTSTIPTSTTEPPPIRPLPDLEEFSCYNCHSGTSKNKKCVKGSPGLPSIGLGDDCLEPFDFFNRYKESRKAYYERNPIKLGVRSLDQAILDKMIIDDYIPLCVSIGITHDTNRLPPYVFRGCVFGNRSDIEEASKKALSDIPVVLSGRGILLADPVYCVNQTVKQKGKTSTGRKHTIHLCFCNESENCNDQPVTVPSGGRPLGAGYWNPFLLLALASANLVWSYGLTTCCAC